MNARGFSLMELIMVVVIMTLLAAIGIPKMTGKSRLDEAEELFRSKLNQARSYAYLNNNAYRLKWDATKKLQLQKRIDSTTWADTLGATSFPSNISVAPSTYMIRYWPSGLTTDDAGGVPTSIMIIDANSKMRVLDITSIGVIRRTT